MGLTQPFLVSQRNVPCALTNFLLTLFFIIVLYDIFVYLSTNILPDFPGGGLFRFSILRPISPFANGGECGTIALYK